jgi:hypothetical protein
MDDISALTQQLATWDRLGNIAMAAVLAGVVLVAATQFAWLTKWSGLANFPRAQSAIGKLGAVLLIAGVAGAIVSIRSSRNVNERIAGALNLRAAAANERARLLEEDAAELRQQLAKLKWRIVTPEQQATLVEWLSKAPKGPVVVLHARDDEPRSYAVQITDALKAAGFNPKLAQAPAALNVPGLWLLVRDLQQPPPYAVAIQTAFREIHVQVDGQQDLQHVPDANTVVVVIGSRRS